MINNYSTHLDFYERFFFCMEKNKISRGFKWHDTLSCRNGINGKDKGKKYMCVKRKRKY